MSEITNNQMTAPKPAEFKTSFIKVQDKYLTMVEQQMSEHRIALDEYQKTCVMNAIAAMSNAMDKTGISFAHPDVDQTSVTQILLTVAALKLNASATPREVYFQVRNVGKIERDPKTLRPMDQKKWMKVVEMGIEGDGNDAMLRRFGADIKKVGQYWLIRENDDFTPPKYKGMTVEPPTWVPRGSGRVIAVVYPIVKQDGTEEYHLSYRADVKANLLAHLSNNMMNETFGLAADRFKASSDQVAKINTKKAEILDKAEKMTIDEILDDKTLESYISPAWRSPQSREQMIIRKMRNNVTKKIPKDFGSGYASAKYEESDRGEEDVVSLKDAGGDSDEITEPKVIDIVMNDEPEETKQESQVKPPKVHPKPFEQALEPNDPFEPPFGSQLGF